MSKATTSDVQFFSIGDAAVDLADGKPQGFVPTGIKVLDEYLVGLPNGELTLVAAKPSQGKTALATTILENNAKGGLITGIISMEMSAKALALRMIAAKSGVNSQLIRKGTLTPKQRKDIAKAAAEMRKLPIYVDDRSGLDGDQVREIVEDWKGWGVGLIALDYIQLMSGVNESRQVQIGDAVRAVKAAAKAADVPLLALSQLNRASNTREDQRPRLSDLRDSGELEQVADNILMFHYPEEDMMEDERTCDIYIMKQRNGPTGVATVKFLRSQTRFVDY